MILATLSRTASIARPSIAALRSQRQQFPQLRAVSMFSFLDRFKESKSARKVKPIAGLRIYEQIADQIDYPSFFHRYNMPNTYNSWFLVTELHVWMTLTRVMAIEDAGRKLRSGVVETMWTDATQRAKRIQSDNPSMMRKQLNVLSQQFQAALITYDDGLMHDDKSMATSLWVRFFDKKCEDYENLSVLVEYVRRQIQMLERIPDEEFLDNPKIEWEKITDLKVSHMN
ncbi:ubiquinol-cytochrome-c reductase complex assembly factor 1 [Culicoides brevitarsis]|uniref:ubiquinol-cytochrome-c reductase complex assembly factor 1 n=1 Tax=Culicoides brevitarsis TaxID=469753 RepID=UPI00307BB29D